MVFRIEEQGSFSVASLALFLFIYEMRERNVNLFTFSSE